VISNRVEVRDRCFYSIERSGIVSAELHPWLFRSDFGTQQKEEVTLNKAIKKTQPRTVNERSSAFLFKLPIRLEKSGIGFDARSLAQIDDSGSSE
jgi:hypothetical protein